MMSTQWKSKGLQGRRWLWSAVLLITVALVVTGSALVLQPAAVAHCDSIHGPVVLAAKQALERGQVALILPYVQADAEAELTAAFEQTLAVRKVGDSAQALADRYFFETAVRLHRQGEGAPYTGLQEESDFGPALEAAEKALATGDLKPLHLLLDKAVQDGIREKFTAVQAARSAAEEEGTVATHRERVEAELLFETYINQLYTVAAEGAVHHEGE